MNDQHKNQGRQHNQKNKLFFYYLFQFEDGKKQRFAIFLDPLSLQYLPQRSLEGDEWTRLDHEQRENCPLIPEKVYHCPVALSIKDLVNEFKDKVSYHEAKITVQTAERAYFKKTALQKGISSTMGILMVSSGCPIMDKLRPMVRFHLPFSTSIETTFRTTGIYLLGQFLLQQNGKSYDYTMEKLVEIIENVNLVNRGMARRIQTLESQDASVNALIILDTRATDVSMSIEDQIDELRPYFVSYFE